MKKWLTAAFATLLFWTACQQNEPNSTAAAATGNDPKLAAVFESYL